VGALEFEAMMVEVDEKEQEVVMKQNKIFKKLKI